MHHPNCGHPSSVMNNYTCKYAGKKRSKHKELLSVHGPICQWNYFQLRIFLSQTSLVLPRATNHSPKKLHCGQIWRSAKAVAWYPVDDRQGTPDCHQPGKEIRASCDITQKADFQDCLFRLIFQIIVKLFRLDTRSIVGKLCLKD